MTRRWPGRASKSWRQWGAATTGHRPAVGIVAAGTAAEAEGVTVIGRARIAVSVTATRTVRAPKRAGGPGTPPNGARLGRPDRDRDDARRPLGVPRLLDRDRIKSRRRSRGGALSPARALVVQGLGEVRLPGDRPDL